MAPDAHIRLYPLAKQHEATQQMMLIANDGECANAAVDAVRDAVNVVNIEADARPASAYYPPTNRRTDHDHGPFKFRISTEDGFLADETFAKRLQSSIRTELQARELDCVVDVIRPS